MKVFITGASGYIGTAVTKELIDNGHSVVGLARSDESAQKLTDAGAEVVRGSLDSLDVIASAAAEADGVIHLAFIHDFANFQASAEADGKAIEAIGNALAGSDKPFIVTSGTAGLAPGRVALEDDVAAADTGRYSEAAALPFAEKGVRVVIVRLPPSVHGETDLHGFIPTIISVAEEKSVSGYPNDGTNRWAAVHVLDAAVLYRLALENAPAGTVLHAIGDEAITSHTIAEIIGEKFSIPTEPIAEQDINDHFGWIGRFFSMDIPANGDATRSLMNWEPTHQGLLADLEAGFYFKI